MFASNEAAVSLAGLGRERSVRAWIQWAADSGFRSVALDATAPGVRARELSRSARRELASLLRRHELKFTGLDLWIPPEHFLSREHIDRAAAAVDGAIALAGDVATLNGEFRPVVSLNLPEECSRDTITHLEAAASDAGVVLADHHWPPRALHNELDEALRVGLDPASILLAGADPSEVVMSLQGRLGCVRFTDADTSTRRTVGAGRLDIDSLRTAMMAANWEKPIVIDVRGLSSPAEQAVVALRRWDGRA